MEENPAIRILAQCGRDDDYIVPALAFMMICRGSLDESQFDVIYCTKTHDAIKKPFIGDCMSRLQFFFFGVEVALGDEGFTYEKPPDWYFNTAVVRTSDYRETFDHVVW